MTFYILDPMKPHIRALGKFWLDRFVDHSLCRAIVSLYFLFFLFVAHLLHNLLHVQEFPCVD